MNRFSGHFYGRASRFRQLKICRTWLALLGLALVMASSVRAEMVTILIASNAAPRIQFGANELATDPTVRDLFLGGTPAPMLSANKGDPS